MNFDDIIDKNRVDKKYRRLKDLAEGDLFFFMARGWRRGKACNGGRIRTLCLDDTGTPTLPGTTVVEAL